jgi:hypothetical protein
MVGDDAEEKVLPSLEGILRWMLMTHTFKSMKEFSWGMFNKCFPLPYLAPWIKHAELNIEKI